VEWAMLHFREHGRHEVWDRASRALKQRPLCPCRRHQRRGSAARAGMWLKMELMLPRVVDYLS
jgi:hypothetical protein